MILGSEDYLAGPISADLLAGSTEVCVMFGAIDDNLNPILEDTEFYQISLTTVDNADIEPSQSVADIFIIDNDGVFFSQSVCILNYSIILLQLRQFQLRQQHFQFLKEILES